MEFLFVLKFSSIFNFQRDQKHQCPTKHILTFHSSSILNLLLTFIVPISIYWNNKFLYQQDSVLYQYCSQYKFNWFNLTIPKSFLSRNTHTYINYFHCLKDHYQYIWKVWVLQGCLVLQILARILAKTHLFKLNFVHSCCRFETFLKKVGFVSLDFIFFTRNSPFYN
jgi:hypothetical protein